MSILGLVPWDCDSRIMVMVGAGGGVSGLEISVEGQNAEVSAPT